MVMEIQAFIYKMRDFNSVELADGIFLFKAPKGKWELWNVEDDVEEGEIIDDLRTHPKAVELIGKLKTIEFEVMGGRGAGGMGAVFSWKGDSHRGLDHSMDNLPARVNNKVKVKTREQAIKAFRDMHGKDAGESLVQIDRNGFVHHYRNGNKSNVTINKTVKGATLVHNHPNNSTFSPADMKVVASTNVGSIIATHSKGYREFTKQSHFKQNDFLKAVARVEKNGLKGKGPNDAVDRWLKRNQKKYGYTFKNVLD